MLTQPIVWFFSTIALTVPFWPLYFRSIGLSESEITILLGVGPLTALFAQQIWGYLADTKLNIKTCMAIMAAVCAVISALFPFFRGFWALLVLMGLLAAFTTARIPMVSALILDNRGGEERYGLLRTTGTVSFIVVLNLVSWISDWENGPGVSIIFPLLVAANFLSLVSLIPVRDHPPGGRHRHRADRPSFLEVQRILLSNKVIQAFVPFFFFVYLPHSVSHVMISLLIQDVGAADKNWMTTMPIGIGAVAEIVPFLAFAWVARRVRLMPLIFLAGASGVVRWLMIYTYPTLPVIYFSATLHMFTYGLMHMASVILFNRELPIELRSSGQTLLNMMLLLFSMTLGPFVSSIYLKYFSLHSWYGFSGLLTLIGMPFGIVMARRYNAEHGVSGIFIRAED